MPERSPEFAGRTWNIPGAFLGLLAGSLIKNHYRGDYAEAVFVIIFFGFKGLCKKDVKVGLHRSAIYAILLSDIEIKAFISHNSVVG